MSDHQLALDLPGVSVTPVGVGDPTTITPTQALDALRTLRPVGAAWRWITGDLVLALADHDVTRLHEAWQHLAGLDVDDRPSLMASVLVSIQIPPERRRAGLSWSHHRTVAKLPPEEGDRWLDIAEAEGLSNHDLEGRIRDAREAARQDELPGMKPWRTEHRKTLDAIGKLFAEDPDAVVILAADGSWRRAS